MPRQVSEEDRQTEDDSPTKMTPRREKKTPKSGDFDGHTA